MVHLSKIYTRTGDLGQTGLGDGRRVSKATLRISAMGAIDEANSAVGVARLDATVAVAVMLARIQNDLFDLGADLSVPQAGVAREERKPKRRLRISAAQVFRLEHEIDVMNKDLDPLTSFVLPGGTALAARLHLARAVVRRAEVLLVALGDEEPLNPEALRYANRLSDHLFVMARTANRNAVGDVLWVPGAHRSGD